MSMPCKSQANSEIAPEAELPKLLDRLKQDHAELLQVLMDLENQASQTEREADKNHAMVSLLHLRLWTLGFKEELNRHSEWEERELFPLLNICCQGHNTLSATPTLCDLEKDHELAMNYMDTFLRAVHALKSDSEAMPMKQAASYLTYACRILIKHLEQEEKLIYPLTEQVSTDTSYFSYD
ncbi:hemerythrin [Paenibacillus sp. LMG 31456]|uniref:Hemerythrin n=1 Tax=Paenibacillus foliorum TaxID=2654974 RepID=A0A972GTI4_9BACL|nr:hemerythrin domain-containing protein [Paenibacillus foliorum]NOU95900.1 hemerythrin [Paenibacillus foliorum]